MHVMPGRSTSCASSVRCSAVGVNDVSLQGVLAPRLSWADSDNNRSQVATSGRCQTEICGRPVTINRAIS